jgi:hypothetical protein
VSVYNFSHLFSSPSDDVIQRVDVKAMGSIVPPPLTTNSPLLKTPLLHRAAGVDVMKMHQRLTLNLDLALHGIIEETIITKTTLENVPEVLATIKVRIYRGHLNTSFSESYEDRPNNRGVKSPEKSKNNHLAGAREGEQRRGSLPSFPAQDFRLERDDHDRRPTATKSGNSSPTHSGRTSPTSSGRTSPTMTRSKSTDFRHLNQDTSPESKGEGRRSRKNSRHHHRHHNDGIQVRIISIYFIVLQFYRHT